VIASRIFVGVVGLALSMPGAGPVSAQTSEGRAAPTGGQELDEILSLVEARNPRLRALRFAADAADSREPEASTLPDPVFQFGVMNFGVPNLNTDMAMSMAPSVQLMQMVPFPGKLSLKGEIAAYSSEMAGANAREAWWNVRREASSLFFDLYSLDRRLEVMRETFALLRDFRDVARAMYVSGTGRQADVLRADVEIARMDGEIQRMEAMRTAQAARLNALMDRPAATEVQTPLLGLLPLDVPDPDSLLAWARSSRPILERGRLAVDQARTRGELADRDIWPDFTVGLSYGQRDRGLGTERMASAMIGFSLPIHAGRRQFAAREEMLAMEGMARAELIGWEASVDAEIGVLLAELGRARQLVALYRDEVIPEARATVESAFSSYRVGSVDFMTLIDAEMMVNRYEGELFQLLAEYGKGFSAMESVVGRPLPRSNEILSEAR
jgi:cobalt-zinc-cadmium efflux system outer membrane protein